MIEKLCEFCGNMFQLKVNSQKFCSRKCSGQSKVQVLEKECEVCKKHFKVSGNQKKNKCCSKECSKKCQFYEHNKYVKQLIPEIKEYRKDHTPLETANEFGVSPSTLVGWGVVGPEAEKRLLCPNVLTLEQEEAITGNLLGDGSIVYIKNDNQNVAFRIGQRIDRAEYLQGLYEIYNPFSCNICESESRKPSKINGKINHDLEHWNGEYCYSTVMYTVTHPIFTNLRHKWYKDPYTKKSLKIVPSDIHLTWRTVANWMCDDGSNYPQKGKKSLSLYTDCFIDEDVEFLIEKLQIDLQVASRIGSRGGCKYIKIYGDDWFYFIENIKPFIPWQCFKYKCIHEI